MGPSLVVSKRRQRGAAPPGSRWARRVAALAVLAALPLVAATPAVAAPTLSADDPPALGSRDIEPTWDDNEAGLAEAFSFKATDDGPVDVVNVYLGRYWDSRKVGRPGARLIAGVYADANGRPGTLLGQGSLTTFRYSAWNTVPIAATELEKGKTYWIAMLGLRDQFVFRTSTPGLGTSASVTSPKNLSALQSPWKTVGVYPKDSPISAYAAERYSVLVFTKNSTGNNAEGVAALRSLANANEVTFDVTDDASKFTESNLANYRAVVFLNTAGDVLDEAQQEAFESYFRGGGGFLGIHSAIETEPDWPFMTQLLGTRATGRTDPLSATTKVADRGHLASKGLPEYWTRTDRWYNFTSNVRGFSHVLATVDENTYTGGTNGFDHPIAWCKDYQGGRSFYTGAGGTAQSFGESGLRRHLAGALDWAAGKADEDYSDCGATVLANFQQTKISAPPNINEPIGIDQLPDGRILQTVRDGRIRLHDPVSGTSTVIATIPVYTNSEDGLYGPAVDNDFAENKWVYFYYAPVNMEGNSEITGKPYPATTPNGNAPTIGANLDVWDPWRGYFQLSRFKFVDGPNPTIDLASEQKIMKVEVDRGACCHVAGDIDFDKDNNLWLVTGDDTPATAVGTANNPPINDQKTNEIQLVTFTGTTGGTFTLTFDGQTTAPLTYPGNNAAIEAALEALPNLDNVFVANQSNQQQQNKTINFGGIKERQDVPLLTVDRSALVGANPQGAVSTTTEADWFHAPFNDARRGSTNTNDLRGKILRIKVGEDGGYSVPAGNMFAPGTAQTRPEIYAMGFRNPFRIQVDEDGVAYVADYSPDSNGPTGLRAAAGTGRIEIVRKPSNYGWPMCYKTDLPMYKWDFNTQNTLGETYACDGATQGPVNESRWNTGMSVLPPITNPDVWYSFRDDLWGTPCFASYNVAVPVQNTCSRIFPELGQGGVGPHVTAKYDYDPDSSSATKFPPYYDDALFFGEWTRDYLREIRIDSNNKVFKINNVLNCGGVGSGQPFECDNPMDGQFGADGNFYLLTYGDGFFTQNPDAGVYRWSYVKGQRAPNAVMSADRTDGALPLTVNFSSAGSRDPDPGDALTFEWDFDGNGTVDSTDPNPSHTYTTAGVYVAKLTVRDSNDKTDVKTITITAGNTSPTVTINVPVDGDFFDWGETIPYTVTVTDPEDGAIDCSRVTVSFVLVHDEHGHAGESKNGCSGTFATNAEDANHGGSIAAGISASYTDLGAPGGLPALSAIDQNVVQMRRQQVEFVTEQSGTNTAATNDPEGGGLQRGSLASGDWIALNRRYFLGNMEKKIRFRFAGGAADNTAGLDRVNVEIRSGSATGDLITTVTLKSTGANNNTWTTQEFPLDFAGSQRLFLVFRQIPGGPAAANNTYGNLNWVEFVGEGVGAELP